MQANSRGGGKLVEQFNLSLKAYKCTKKLCEKGRWPDPAEVVYERVP